MAIGWKEMTKLMWNKINLQIYNIMQMWWLSPMNAKTKMSKQNSPWNEHGEVTELFFYLENTFFHSLNCVSSPGADKAKHTEYKIEQKKQRIRFV